jgi:hypothetical protein
MLPIAAGMLMTAKPAVVLTGRVGTKFVVATGLAVVAGGLILVSGLDAGTGDLELCLTLGSLGAGIGLAMAPATEAIMGSLPKAKAGIGSAMNDVVREVGGTLGIAVLGSILATSYASGMDGAPEAARDSVGAAHAVAAQTGATDLVATANQAFVDAMSTTACIAAAIAMVGAVIALAFLPARARTEKPGLVPEPAMA